MEVPLPLDPAPAPFPRPLPLGPRPGGYGLRTARHLRDGAGQPRRLLATHRLAISAWR